MRDDTGVLLGAAAVVLALIALGITIWSCAR
jgi:hypothetical protein